MIARLQQIEQIDQLVALNCSEWNRSINNCCNNMLRDFSAASPTRGWISIIFPLGVRVSREATHFLASFVVVSDCTCPLGTLVRKRIVLARKNRVSIVIIIFSKMLPDITSASLSPKDTVVLAHYPCISLFFVQQIRACSVLQLAASSAALRHSPSSILQQCKLVENWTTPLTILVLLHHFSLW